MRKALDLFYLVFLQPAGLLMWAAIVIGFHLVFRFLGWREMTTVLSGTAPEGMSLDLASGKASLYLASYFAAVLVAPVMILAAVFSVTALRKLAGHK